MQSTQSDFYYRNNNFFNLHYSRDPENSFNINIFFRRYNFCKWKSLASDGVEPRICLETYLTSSRILKALNC